MFTDAMSALYISLYIVPFSILRYYPYLDKLRISIKSLCIIYGAILFVQITLFIFLSKCHFWNLYLTQSLRLGFAVIYALLSFIIIKERFFKHFFMYLMMVMYNGLICGTAHLLEIYLHNYYFYTQNHVIVNIAIILQLAVSYPLVFTFIKKRFKPLLAINTDVWNYIWVIPAIFIAYGILFGIDLSPATILNWRYFTARCLLVMGIFSSFFVLIKILEQTNQNATLNENMRMTNKLLIAQANHYKLLTDNINKARAAKHDLRHHIVVMQSYLHNNELNLLKEYLDEYETSFQENTKPMLCNNYVIDAILQYYAALAEAAAITFTTKVDIPYDISINDLDLCIILGNAIENALEACAHVTGSKKHIKLHIKIVGSMLIITLDNSYAGLVKQNGSVFISSKRGSEEGIGIASIKSVAQKYNGVVQINFTQEVFKVSIMLKLTE